MNLFAQRLKELREEKNLSQNQLSKTIKVSNKTIAKWELGETSPTKDNIIALAKFFNCTAGYLIGIEN